MKVLRNLINRYGKYNLFYMFVMVIYMAQATTETGRMVGSISGNPIPFLLPILLTIILCKKHSVSFHSNRLLVMVSVYLFWAICCFLKYNILSTEELSYYFFMFYAILIAYIHCKVFGDQYLSLYEDIMVFFCKIAIIGWLIAVIFPSSASLFRMFPETSYGNHILYLFNWMDPLKGQVTLGLLRNAGCSWEPGRFAIMIVLAIYCNLCYNGIKFSKNNKLWWLLVALVTTQSTTGYSSLIILYIMFFYKKINVRTVLISVFVVVPSIYGIFQIDFMGNKILTKIEESKNISRLNESFTWNAKTKKKGEYLASIDRFDSMYFEWINFVNDPILGYGRNFENSYFYKKISTNFVLANGLVRILGNYGIVLGGLFFYILYLSSRKITQRHKYKRKWALFILLILFSLSYQVLSIPVFTTFWLYGLFSPTALTRKVNSRF